MPAGNGARGERRRAGIRDVAERAGVSTATVSLVLRDRPGPSEATRTLVRDVAAQLGYRADRAASLLARKRSHLVGAVIDVTSPFHAELVTYLDAAAAAAGLELVLSTVGGHRTELDAADALLDHRCEAVLLLGPSSPSDSLRRLVDLAPTVVLGRAVSGLDCVLVDDAAGLHAAVDHLVATGRSRIVYVDGPPGDIADVRRRGYRQAVRDHGVPPRVLAGGADERAGAAAADGLGEADAVICFNDRSAVGVREALLRAGREVPDDLALVGFDDSPLARVGTLDLTSVSQAPAQLAAAAVARVVGRLEDPSGAAVHQVLSPQLVVRSSSAPRTPQS